MELDTEKFVSIQKAHKQCEMLEGQNVDGLVFPETIMMPDQEFITDLKLTPWYTEDRDSLQQVLQSIWKDYSVVDWAGIEEKNLPGKEIISIMVNPKRTRIPVLYIHMTHRDLCVVIR